MKNALIVDVDYDTLADFLNLAVGSFSPLTGFVNRQDFAEILTNYRLTSGETLTMPITLSVDGIRKNQGEIKRIIIRYLGQVIGEVEVNDIYTVTDRQWHELYKTSDSKHPGLAKQLALPKTLVGGKVHLTDKTILDKLDIITPSESKAKFKSYGWETVVGFQTRNAIHRAHEHLQRIGLEICDGLFISPMIGWKKPGDFTEEAITKAYEVMISKFYPKNRVFFHGLRLAMRYLGPREAIMHAVIRKNLGCTHFIVGRDHAGVGGFYGPYEAHELARELQKRHDLGIELLLLSEASFCPKCGQMTTCRSCGHNLKPDLKVSGTRMRSILQSGNLPDPTLMRPEIAKALLKLNQVFIPKE